MKTKRKIFFMVICLGLIALTVIIKLWPLSTIKERYHFVGYGPIESNAQRNALGFIEGYFKTITDERTGQYAIVSPDKRNVILKNKYGLVVWSVDVITPLEKGQVIIGGQEEHAIFFLHLNTNEVNGQIVTNELLVQGGEDIIGINIETGKVKYYGSN